MVNKIIDLKVKPNTAFIKYKIEELKLTQQGLAKELSVAHQTFNGWVTGRITPSLAVALWLSERLDCSVNDLFELIQG